MKALSLPDFPLAEQPPPGIHQLETEIVALFMHLVQAIGAPKSLGAIYGCLFLSETPLSFEEIGSRLDLSAGSVSQGLKALRTLGAVRSTFVPGDRRDHYVAEMRLRHLVAGFLGKSMKGYLANGEDRLDQLDQLLSAAAAQSDPSDCRARIEERVQLLRNWHARAQTILPLLMQLLGAPAEDQKPKVES